MFLDILLVLAFVLAKTIVATVAVLEVSQTHERWSRYSYRRRLLGVVMVICALVLQHPALQQIVVSCALRMLLGVEPSSA
jgi:hypothetical protein